jgi:cytochrome c oxidase cbb3-type subunit 3
VLLLLAACTTPKPPAESGADTAQVAVVAETLTNPLAGNADAAKSGEGLFASMNCDGCHGGGGLGFVGPNLVDGRWRFGGSDGDVYRSIFAGRAQGMPAYGKLLAESTIWQLVTYIKSQPVPVDVATEAWP